MSRRNGLAAPAVLTLLVAGSVAAQSRVQLFRAPADVSVRRVESVPGDRLLLQGTRGTSPWIAELAGDGSVVRQREIATPATITVVKATADGGVILAGQVTVGGSVDAFFSKLDAAWRVEWTTVHGTPDRGEFVSDIAPVSDGGWMAVGSMSEGGMVMRLDASGAVSFLRSCSTPRYRDGIQAIASLGADRWLVAMTGRIRFTEEGRIVVAELRADGTLASGSVIESVSGGMAWQLLALPDGSSWILGSGCESFCTSYREVAVHRTPGGGIDRVLVMDADLGGSRGALTDAGYLVVTGSEFSSGTARRQALIELDAAGNVLRSNALETTTLEAFSALAMTSRGLIGVGMTDGFDGTSAPMTGWLVLLDDALQAPAGCGLDQAPDLPPVSQLASQSSTTVPSTTWTGVTSAVPVTLLPGPLTSSIECSGVPLLPREVSPAGAATPLLVRDREVLTWEDGSFSGSDTFDVHRGDLLALRSRDYGGCWRSSLMTTTVTDSELPGDGNGFFYLVAGRNSAGLGPVGYDSLGVESVPPARCP